MFTKTIIKRTTETNSDVSNTPPTVAKQDCSDVVHISVFLMVQNNKEMLMKKKKWSNPSRL